MAGFYDIISKGELVPPTATAPPRPYEVVQEMYGMIYYLADQIHNTSKEPLDSIINKAVENHKYGLGISPTKRYGGSGNE